MVEDEIVISTVDLREVPAPDSPTLGPVTPEWPVREGDLVEVRSVDGLLAIGVVSNIDKNGVALVDYVGKSRITSTSSLWGSLDNRIRVHVRYLAILQGPSL